MLKNNKVAMAVSLVIAILLWGIVMGQVNPTTATTLKAIPIQLEGGSVLADKGLAISGNQEFTVDVYVEGKRNDLSSINRAEIIVTADVSNCVEGENRIPLKVVAPGNLLVTGMRAQSITVNVEALVKRSVDVRLVFEGELGEGLEVSDVSIAPLSVEVNGARSKVTDVAYAEARIDYANISEELLDYSLTLQAVRYNGEAVDDVYLSNASCVVTMQLLSTKSVELKLELSGELSEGYEFGENTYPEAVVIKGNADALANIDSVDADPIMVTNLAEGSNEVKLTVQLPDGIYLADSSKELTAQIVVQKKAEADETENEGDSEAE